GFSLAGLSIPCRSVGGDFFDYLQLPQGLVGVLLGDVAGKGLPAALLMSSLMARVQVLAEVTSDPAELVTRLNRIFALSCPANRFVTFFLLVLDPATGEFTYCNAGHNPPYLRRASGEIEQLADGGPVVGVLKKFTYHGVKGQLNAGDSILLYSDGVTEARSPLDEEFGEERLEAMVRECPGCHASELLRRLHLPVEMFMSTAPSADDLTMVVLRRDP
ncbi:MAG TPA: PP2C family protein-serine/threonine phosphatase, partial [Bryobacteraceae bacterium]|nr:PP2C family protein-serine/threonine phosphatase [Bryobacteraceae bacterium]